MQREVLFRLVLLPIAPQLPLVVPQLLLLTTPALNALQTLKAACLAPLETTPNNVDATLHTKLVPLQLAALPTLLLGKLAR